jgi:hypothetical protein
MKFFAAQFSPVSVTFYALDPYTVRSNVFPNTLGLLTSVTLKADVSKPQKQRRKIIVVHV